MLDDEEQAAKAEEEARRTAEEKAKAKEEAEAEAAKDPLEVEFNEEEANYQEDTFMKRNVRPMGNKDIIEAVGLPYEFISYEEKPKVKKKKAWERKSPAKKLVEGVDGEFDQAEIEAGDEALPDDDEEAKSAS